jgi:hypothetical protein
MKKKILFWALFFILCPLLTARYADAAQISSFTVSPTATSFADQDPDSYAEVTSSSSLAVNFTITNLTAAQSWTLDIQANTNLVSGSNIIPAGNIRWTVTGSGTPTPTFYNNTLVLGSYVLAGTGHGRASGNVTITSTFYFYLRNYWTYSTGNYSGTVTFRLTVPRAGGGTRTSTRTVTLSTNIAARAKLQFGLLAMSFPDADPGSVPSDPANVNPLSVTSSARTGASSTAMLTCLASGDLISGINTIAISNITWTATGAGYVAGTMNRTTAQTAGSWTGSGQRTGTFSYFLVNSWSYAIGNYSTSINYTLTAP